ncbi:L-serine dehydratase [Mycolicibacterium helvum]|uniref:L-serine dehydratase n=1 Tax=Mycolicibacterium helvum TaxID=1534349 RepID=A0A7I7TAS8_9MYCO|nr:L-serine dehydratase [Mycolicibacterium helvum]
MGPMRAASRFAANLRSARLVPYVDEFAITIYGSLAATGDGHGTFPAILLGLEGLDPETIDIDDMAAVLARQRRTGRVRVAGQLSVNLGVDDLIRRPAQTLDFHPNGMTFVALAEKAELLRRTYYSVGGGFIVDDDEKTPSCGDTERTSPYAFSTAEELLALTAAHGISISEVQGAHERELAPEVDVAKELLRIRDAMRECAAHGMVRTGTLPGGLQVRRRAHHWHDRLAREDPCRSPEFAEDWVNLVALAVNEENASGGRVVTAPTNGAAGIIPAVLHYAEHYTKAGRIDPDDVAVRFLLAAGAIGSLYKQQASISGAEVGCQGEVGSAASMAAGALAEILGGTTAQVENAAEIAMEHCLGLTCDPIGGLVQIPCIERNAISANKAITAAKMALRGDGTHRVSLDQVIATMRSTGRDMSSKYKETALGGLAANVGVNLVEC